MTKTIMKLASAFAFYIMILCLWSGIAIATKSQLNNQIKFTLYSMYKSQFATLVNVKDLTILLIKDAKIKLNDQSID
tara:strand:- start:3215 stop:3445 length:231 start_codon:yes stop_codon:yes gene_type:complete